MMDRKPSVLAAHGGCIESDTTELNLTKKLYITYKWLSLIQLNPQFQEFWTVNIRRWTSQSSVNASLGINIHWTNIYLEFIIPDLIYKIYSNVDNNQPFYDSIVDTLYISKDTSSVEVMYNPRIILEFHLIIITYFRYTHFSCVPYGYWTM